MKERRGWRVNKKIKERRGWKREEEEGEKRMRGGRGWRVEQIYVQLKDLGITWHQ